ncbi:MAG: hypothetical protein BWY68_00602 [bacterium ADurb.Bin400]|nr:MAG: hypothetical protein BWY68_00602 [bacterium ADurb.Bin400]
MANCVFSDNEECGRYFFPGQDVKNLVGMGRGSVIKSKDNCALWYGVVTESVISIALIQGTNTTNSKDISGKR